MKPLELTVSEEQVKGFLREQVEDFYGDWESPRNYISYIAQAKEKLRLWSRVQLPGDVREYLDNVRHIFLGMTTTLKDINTPDPFPHPDRASRIESAINKHYLGLVQLIDVYGAGMSLDIPESMGLLKDEILRINGLLKRQIFVVNMLYDPEKCRGEFREKLRGVLVEFAKYVEAHIEER